jgi:hypothetical protein
VPQAQGHSQNGFYRQLSLNEKTIGECDLPSLTSPPSLDRFDDIPPFIKFQLLAGPVVERGDSDLTTSLLAIAHHLVNVEEQQHLPVLQHVQ